MSPFHDDIKSMFFFLFSVGTNLKKHKVMNTYILTRAWIKKFHGQLGISVTLSETQNAYFT